MLSYARWCPNSHVLIALPISHPPTKQLSPASQPKRETEKEICQRRQAKPQARLPMPQIKIRLRLRPVPTTSHASQKRRRNRITSHQVRDHASTRIPARVLSPTPGACGRKGSSLLKANIALQNRSAAKPFERALIGSLNLCLVCRDRVAPRD